MSAEKCLHCISSDMLRGFCTPPPPPPPPSPRRPSWQGLSDAGSALSSAAMQEKTQILCQSLCTVPLWRVICIIGMCVCLCVPTLNHTVHGAVAVEEVVRKTGGVCEAEQISQITGREAGVLRSFAQVHHGAREPLLGHLPLEYALLNSACVKHCWKAE